MNVKTISQLDKNGRFVGATTADESPLEPGVFLMPAGAVDFSPPVIPSGHYAEWNGAGFDLVEIETEDTTPPTPTTEQIIEGFKSAIQASLDEAARAKNYDDIVSACSYAGYPNVFQAEAIAFGQWRANVWAYGYAELDKVIAGTRPVPTIAEILAELPALVLP